MVLRPVPLLPCSRLPRFIKKLTVIGMIGHTQGVRTAIKPPINPKRKIVHRDGIADSEEDTGADGDVRVGAIAEIVSLIALVALVSLVALVVLVSLV